MSSPPPASEAAAQALGRLGSDVRDLDPAVHGEDLNAATGYALEDIATVREYVAALEARVEVELELRKAAYERIAALEARLAEAERALREIAGYYAGCRSRDTGKSICANRALAALPPESGAGA